MPERGRYIGLKKIPETKKRVTTHSSHDFVANFPLYFNVENTAGKLLITISGRRGHVAPLKVVRRTMLEQGP